MNLVPPARVALYESLARALDLVILHGSMEANRASWRYLRVSSASSRRVAGWQSSINKRESGRVADTWFLHIEPGYIPELVRERPDAVITEEMGFRTLVGLAYGTCFRKPMWVWWGGTPHTGSAAPTLEVQPRPVLLHVGQMIGRKGVAEFLRAAARLQREGLTFSIELVGGGRDSGRLQRLATELGLENVHFYPAQPPEAMPAFYRSGDVLSFPTMEDVWGPVANEAVLSGLPVLCSRYAGCAPELFDPECIFDPADEKQFVAALRKAVRGQLPRPDRSRLWSSAKLGELIANALLESCAGQPAAPPVRRPVKQS